MTRDMGALEKQQPTMNGKNAKRNMDLRIAEKQGKKHGVGIAEVVVPAVLAASFIFSCIDTLDLDSYRWWILIAALATAFAIGLSKCFAGEGREAPRICAICALILIPAVTGIAGYRFTRDGMAVFLNSLRAHYGAAHNTIYEPFETICSETEYASCVTWICVLVAIWLTQLLALDFCKRGIVAVMSVSMLLMIAGHAVNAGEMSIWSVPFAICVAVVLSRHFAGRYASGDGVRISEDVSACTVIALAAVAAISAYAAFTVAGGEKSGVTEDIRSYAEGFWHGLRYGDDSERSMPMGNFNNLDDLNFSSSTMLSIESDEFDSFYLRGFVGGEYTGNGWESAAGEELYARSDELYWLHESGMFGQSQLAYAALSLTPESVETRLSMSITNIGADSSVYYTPYETTSIGTDKGSVLASNILDDACFFAVGFKGQRSYVITSLENQVSGYTEIIKAFSQEKDDEGLDEYRHIESHYNSIVYELYTALGDDERRLLANHLGEWDTDDDTHIDYGTAKENILNYLGENTRYSEEIQTRGGDMGFLQDFLDVSMSGYSVHYATAAALMFRYYGIPARYVEGYLITPEMAEQGSVDGSLTITDESAHAWVEYYQDGVGWVPFETTPSYIGVMDQPEDISASDEGTWGSVSGEGKALEMTEDNYEPQEDESEEDGSLPWSRILGGLLLLIIMAALIAATRHLILRRKRLAALRASLEVSDKNERAINMFAYILRLHEALGIIRRNCSVYEYGEDVRIRMDGGRSEKYMKAARIYQKAAYSTDDVEDAELSELRAYKEDMMAEIRRACPLMKRAHLRWIRGLY